MGLSTVQSSPRPWRSSEFDDQTGDWVQFGEVIDAEQEMKRVRTFKALNLKPHRVHRIIYGEGSNAVRFVLPVGIAPNDCNGSGLVKDFSRKSRQALMWFMASIDRTRLQCGRVWFITLTYPGVWSPDPKQWKRDLDTWRKRLERCYGRLPFVWKLEPQRRGAPHFHLFLVVPPEWSDNHGKLSEFREWLSRSWFEVVGSGDTRHLFAGTGCDPMRSWDGVASYTAKYLCKTVDGVEIVSMWTENGAGSCGRFWGVRFREQFPITLRSRVCSPDGAVRLRRLVRKYVARQGYKLRGLSGRVQPCSCFVPASIIERAWLWAFPESEVIESLPARSSAIRWWALSASDADCRESLRCLHPGD